MTLADFLLARIAEDEAVARMPPPGPWSFVGEPRETSVFSEPTGVTVAQAWQRDARHIALHDPARVLAECEAKRRIVEGIRDATSGPVTEYCIGPMMTTDDVLQLLTLPYADHPDWREEWRP